MGKLAARRNRVKRTVSIGPVDPAAEGIRSSRTVGGAQPGSVYLGDQKLPVMVPRVRI